MSDILTAQEAAALLRVHEKTVRRMILRGDLPAVRVGKSYRIARADLPTAPLERRQPRKVNRYRPSGSVARALVEAEMAS